MILRHEDYPNVHEHQTSQVFAVLISYLSRVDVPPPTLLVGVHFDRLLKLPFPCQWHLLDIVDDSNDWKLDV